MRELRAASGQPASRGGTPEQLEAMRESMEILSDPDMAKRVRAGREAVAAADLVAFENVDGSVSTPGEWRVALTGPVARGLAQMTEPSAAAVREVLAALATNPEERGRALGLGLVGVWSARGAAHRVLYAIREDRRLVTVLTVDGP